jgi:hypothetical protein
VGTAAEVWRSLGPGWDPIQGQSVFGSSISCSLCVDSKRVPVNVVQVVALEMVAWVRGSAGSGEEASGWDTKIEESKIVGAGSKRAVRYLLVGVDTAAGDLE